ncbi:MAG: hypothetical protein ABEL76_10825, partial [Bradymonadaceae bacterium]
TEDGRRVAIETSLVGVDTPPGWPRDDRERLLKTVLGRDASPATPQSPAEMRVLESDEVAKDGAVAVDEPLDRLLEAARRRGVRSFQGDRLLLGDPETG